MRHPRAAASAKTLVMPSVCQRQRRPQHGTCQWPEIWDPPYSSRSETRMKSHERAGNSWQVLRE
eukprot:7556318-Lingulodinium_polyedra.AAC.1